jgi:two-component system, OmpR family, aerobic respiration control sensor histidine kinase ArcB
VLNLLSNAVKFTDEGQRHPRLWPTAPSTSSYPSPTPDPGIAAEDLERIFDEFEQAGSGAGKTGTGLGLAISRRLAELLGGTLRVESEWAPAPPSPSRLPRPLGAPRGRAGRRDE